MKKYKVYEKGNYIYIEDVEKSETFRGSKKDVFVDKSNTNRPIYRFLNVKDWKNTFGIEIVDILKEDGTPYTEQEFDTFYETFTQVFKSPDSGATLEVTYTELLALQTNSELIKGQVYLLTDYMTTYTQPVTGISKSSGVTEQLYITATDVNKLHNQCKSKLHPEDIVYYEISGDIGYGTEGFTKGKIYRRIDTIRNNDIGTDWRYVKYDRSGVDKLLFEDYIDCFNNVIKTYFLFDSVVGNGFYSNTIGRDFKLNTIGNSFNSNTIGDNFFANTIVNNFSGNTIGNNFFLNTIGDDFNSNITVDYFLSNTIGYNFKLNNFGNNFSGNTIGNNFLSNNFGNKFSSNTLGNSFNANIFGFECYSNIFDNNINNYHFNNNIQSKDFTGLLTTTNTQKEVYKQQDGTIILSSVDNFGDTILETL